MALAFVVALTSRGARADDVEAIAIDYQAPRGCPDADAFYREIAARTRRARRAGAREQARVLRIAISDGPMHLGRLSIDDGSTREVEGAACAEVVGALGLIAALALDPLASTESRTAPESAPPASPAPPALPPSPGAPRPAAPRARPPLSAGAQVEGAVLADLVLAGRVFVDLDLGVPSFRIAAARSLDVPRVPSVGSATLRWTLGSIEGCPLRIPLGAGFAVRPCAALAAGALEGEGAGVSDARSRVRPWVSADAHARLLWEPTRLLGLELEVGGLVPFYRESFSFEPGIRIYEAPALALFGRAGAAVRFP